MEAMTTLVTFLGRVPPDQQGYREAKYSFPDGIRSTKFFGLELARTLRPDKVVILGTSASQWDYLVEELAEDGQLETARLELMEAAHQERVTSGMLQNLVPVFQKRFQAEVAPRLIPYGKTAAEQEQILQTIADTVPEGNVHFDVTHAFRHLGMVGFTSAFMLGHLRKICVQSLWYGAFGMTRDDISPVLKLDGLNQVHQWTLALAQHEASGDYGVFADLLEQDGFPQDAAKQLMKAAYFERIHNVGDAARCLTSVLQKLEQPLTGAAELFRPTLRDKLSWANIPSLEDRQKHLAWESLRRRDFPRAAIYGLEAAKSHLCRIKGFDQARFAERDEAWKGLLTELRENRKSGNHAPLEDDIHKLRLIRNSVAHGLPASSESIRSILRNPERLTSELQLILERVLGRPGRDWPWP